ncbi:MAG: ABC-F family ATP-binding cassette domain-containing protein [Lentisphaeria bacterium]|nr:ABC-F family ATP-binding cassette domain-containing protein [Lentisphaeria bacterium]
MAQESGKVLWTGDDLHFSIGRDTLLNGAFFSIMDGERVALVGRNGSGKSTLLRIINGQERLDSGTVTRAKDLRVSFMPQDFDWTSEKTVREVVREGLAVFENALQEYERTGQGGAFLDLHNAWNLENKLDTMLEKLAFGGEKADKPFSCLSGGERRRALLARAIIGEPELLLLDEPTNHLDVNAVAGIEEFLASYRGACLLVTHDRYFLDRVATRIVELDHGKMYSVDGSYADFLEAKAEREYNEDVLEQKRKAFLRREIEWVRRSPKARLKRNLGREKRYYEIAAQTGPERTADMELVIPPPTRLGNKVVSLKDVSLTLGGKELLNGFSCEFTAGHKVGIVGTNGVGKSSLLKLVTGERNPDSGEVEVAQTVQFNCIDQNREVLDPEKTVLQEVGAGKEHIQFGSERLTVWTYLKRFLFTDERIKTQVKYLSGGEKARLALAKELKNGGNFLILDEPTNDLDLPTLRILEEALAAYDSTILVVSHDRYFLNRVCNHILAFDKPGHPAMNVGDYDYYASRRKEPAAPSEPEKKKDAPAAPQPKKSTAKKLSYMEDRELSQLENEIPELEDQIAALEEKFNDPASFADPVREMRELTEKIAALRGGLEKKYARWEELSEKLESLKNLS